MKKINLTTKVISLLLVFNLFFFQTFFINFTYSLDFERPTSYDLNELLNINDKISKDDEEVLRNLEYLVDRNYPKKMKKLKTLVDQSFKIKKEIGLLQILCDAQKASIVYDKNKLVGIENLGNSCFLNSALQMILNSEALYGESINEKIISGIGPLLKSKKLKKLFISNCPTVYALFNLFRLVNYSLMGLDVLCKDYVNFLLKYLNVPAVIYNGTYQGDSTETLQIIIERTLSELKGFYKYYNLKEKYKRHLEKIIVFLENMYCFTSEESKEGLDHIVCKSKEISEGKITNKIDLALENDVFDKEKILANVPQNLIIQMPRCYYKKVDTGNKDPKTNAPIFTTEFLKIENKIKIPEYLNIKNEKYRIKAITIQTGSALSGHYFVYVLKGGNWFELNDSKVNSLKLNTENVLKSDLVLKNSANVLYAKCK